MNKNPLATIPAADLDDDQRNGRLLKFFALSCAASAVIILGLVGASIYVIFNRFILTEAEADAMILARALSAREAEKLIHTVPGGEAFVGIDEKEFPAFDRRARADLGLFNMSKIKIYSKQGEIVYSTDPRIIGVSDRGNEGLNAALKGEVVSEFEHDHNLWDLEDEQKVDRDMIETYVPIKDERNTTLGAFEIYMDVSAYRKTTQRVIAASLGALVVILIGVFGTMLYLMRIATKTIYSKTVELRNLHGLLPICSFCKKIRNQEGEWEALEAFISKRSDSEFSHGLCPECKEEHYPGF